MKERVAKILLGFAVGVALVSGGATKTVSAATNGMNITAFNLPQAGDDAGGDDAGGEAVLVESQGKYLLMDTGAEGVSSLLVAGLKSAGVTDLDVYISHTHNDHRGGLQAVCDNFNVGTIYLPDKSIGSEYRDSGTGATQGQIYDILSKIAQKEGAKVQPLQKGSTFGFGSVNAKVLGPVGNYSMAQFANSAGYAGSQSGHYLNNNSLTTMLTSNGIKYLSCGDIEKDEEKALVGAYGSGLDADILKLSHHGLPTSSIESFIVAVTPTYSFAENASYSGTTTTDGKVVKKTYTAQSTVMNYGICYMLGDENKDLVINAENNKITMYRGAYKPTNTMTGWVDVEGIAQTGDGSYTGKNTFYIEPSSGKALTGIQNIGGKYYYLGSGGCLEKGYYEKGKYVPYRSYGSKIRNFNEDGSMTVGFKTIDGNKFYFDESGYKVFGDKKWGIYTLGNDRYAMNENGAIYTNKGKGGWKKYSSVKLRYFDGSGKMITGWKKLSGKYYYLDTKTGYRSLGAKKIGKYIYYFHDSYGYRLTNRWAESKKGDKYFLDKKSKAYTGLKKISGKYYYFDTETGIMQKGLVQIGTKLYYFDKKSGVGKTKGSVKLSGTTYKTNSKANITNAPSFIKKKISSVSAAPRAGAVSVKWKKISGVSGYEVYISNNASGNYQRAKVLTKSTKVSTSISNLESGKTYYIKVRAYKKISGMKVYSKYSSVKTVVIS